MKYLELESYNNFSCIGSKCPFTCCTGGWRIIIDTETDKYYRDVDGDFGDKLHNSIKRENGVSSFILTKDGRCPFLNASNLCDIYINLGESHLCNTCKNHPRYTFLSGDILFAGVSISCPEVCKAFFHNTNKLQIYYGEDKEYVDNKSELFWNSFNNAVHTFTTSIEIVQNRQLTISERLATLTLFLYQFQEHIDNQKDPSGLIELFCNQSSYTKLLPQTGIHQRDIQSKVDFYSHIISFFNEFEEFDKAMPEFFQLLQFFKGDEGIVLPSDKFLEAYASFDIQQSQIWMEQLLVYSLFRYFMQGMDNNDFYDKYIIGSVLFYEIIISTFVLYYLRWNRLPYEDEMIIMISHISRTIEHNDNTRNTLLTYFKKCGVANLPFLLKLFS